MRLLLTISLLAWFSLAQADSIRMLIQQSPLAGSQFYALPEVLGEIRPGDVLDLVRESDNRHDAKAIRVEWRGRKLGYLPRAQNRAVSAAMDRGERLTARVSSISDNKNPWLRLTLEVYAEL